MKRGEKNSKRLERGQFIGYHLVGSFFPTKCGLWVGFLELVSENEKD